MSWLIGCVQALVAYYLLYRIFPWQLQAGEGDVLEGEERDGAELEAGVETPSVGEDEKVARESVR